jgi:hypothetical protein
VFVVGPSRAWVGSTINLQATRCGTPPPRGWEGRGSISPAGSTEAWLTRGAAETDFVGWAGHSRPGLGHHAEMGLAERARRAAGTPRDSVRRTGPTTSNDRHSPRGSAANPGVGLRGNPGAMRPVEAGSRFRRGDAGHAPLCPTCGIQRWAGLGSGARASSATNRGRPDASCAGNHAARREGRSEHLLRRRRALHTPGEPVLCCPLTSCGCAARVSCAEGAPCGCRPAAARLL